MIIIKLINQIIINNQESYESASIDYQIKYYQEIIELTLSYFPHKSLMWIVYNFVSFNVHPSVERFRAVVTFERLHARMSSFMCQHI